MDKILYLSERMLYQDGTTDASYLDQCARLRNQLGGMSQVRHRHGSSTRRAGGGGAGLEAIDIDVVFGRGGGAHCIFRINPLLSESRIDSSSACRGLDLPAAVPSFFRQVSTLSRRAAAPTPWPSLAWTTLVCSVLSVWMSVLFLTRVGSSTASGRAVSHGLCSRLVSSPALPSSLSWWTGGPPAEGDPVRRPLLPGDLSALSSGSRALLRCAVLCSARSQSRQWTTPVAVGLDAQLGEFQHMLEAPLRVRAVASTRLGGAQRLAHSNVFSLFLYQLRCLEKPNESG